MSGQSIVDRLNAAKHTVAGSALGRAVVKATTEEVMGPKRKHLDYLLQCTSEINVSIPQMADLLIERTQNTSWVVTFKSLITIHHLMCYGNERFSQYMASHNSKFILNNFMDRSGTQGIDMSSYIRKYAHYLNEKRETYKLMGYDFCKVKRGKDDGMLRTMTTEKLLKTLPILQKQLDALVQFDVQPNELTNGVINTCFVLLSKDLIRLFACYNDGVINLLEKFFDMNKKNCKEALDIYKKFLDRTDNVSQFLKVAESSGMDKSEIPDLTKAPSSLLEALEAHVNGAEGKKSTQMNSAGATNGSSKPSSSVTNAINSLNNNTSLSAEEKRKVIEEEAKTLEAFKSNHLKKQTSLTSPTGDNVFAASNGKTTTPSSQNDLFGLDLTSTSSQPPAMNANDINKNGNSASDDLLMLSGPNPFIQNIVNQSYSQQNMANLAATNPAMANPFGQPNGLMMQGVQPVGLYQPVNNFAMNPMLNNQNKLIYNNNNNAMMNRPASFVNNVNGNYNNGSRHGSFLNNTSQLVNNNNSFLDEISKPADDLFGGLDFGSGVSGQVISSNSSSNIAANNGSIGTGDFNPFGDDSGKAAHLDSSKENIERPSEFKTSFTGSQQNFGFSNNSENNNNNKAGIDFSEFDAFGDVLQPQNKNSVLNPTNIKQSNTNLNEKTNSTDQKILSTDLDSSLASLANNLDINHKNNNFQKNHQWNTNAQQGQLKTGGQTWNKPLNPSPSQSAAATPMSAAWGSATTTPVNSNWMAGGAASNPFASAAPLPMQPMAAPNLLQQQQPIRPTVPSTNNPFDLF